MMKTSALKCAVPAVIFALFHSVAISAPFDATFRIERIAGDCQVKVSGAGDFAAAEAGKAYPYGSEVKTGAKSVAVVVLSQGNECALQEDVQLVVAEDSADKKIKQIKLNEGQIDVSLEKGFEKSNGFEVQTASAVCGVLGSKVQVLSKTAQKDNLRVGLFKCTEGKMTVGDGKNFSIPDMDPGDMVTTQCPFDRSYVRLRTGDGEFDVVVKGPDASPRKVKTKKGSVIKIFSQKSKAGDKMEMTVVVTDSAEKAGEETWVCELPMAGAPVADEPPPPTATATATTTGVKGEGEELKPLETPTTTTTTTTVPSPTPVGDL